MKFETLKLPTVLSRAIDRLGFTEPTEIQQKSIPYILEGKDVVGKSATGSGKTLAFGCGVVDQVIPRKGLQALILAPTRELAEQVKEKISELSEQLKVISVFGGVAIGPQIQKLQRADVVVATPGRLLDHLDRRTINLSRIKLLVLDEADRMLDMGFVKDVEEIMAACPRQKQTLFFSATISPEIKSLIDKHMNNPVKIAAAHHVDQSKLRQEYYDIAKNKKLSLLIHLVRSERTGLILVFCNTRRTVDFVVMNLKKNKIDAMAIHGGLSQNKRSKIMKVFNDGKVHVLVCTDVAARGLHIENVSHVYNYEIPRDSKDYVHRIGRTARAGEAGKAVNLLSNYDHDSFSAIQRDYRTFSIKKKQVPVLEKVLVTPPEQRRFGQRRPRRHNY